MGALSSATPASTTQMVHTFSGSRIHYTDLTVLNWSKILKLSATFKLPIAEDAMEGKVDEVPIFLVDLTVEAYLYLELNDGW